MNRSDRRLREHGRQTQGTQIQSRGLETGRCLFEAGTHPPLSSAAIFVETFSQQQVVSASPTQIDADRLPALNTERLSGLKPSEALKEANTTRSRSMNKSSYFQGLLFSGHFGEHAWQAPFLIAWDAKSRFNHRDHPPEALDGPQAAF